MNKPLGCVSLTLAFFLLSSAALRAQTVSYKENFTTGVTTNSWYFFNGACLTAGTTSGATSPGQINSCASLKTTYYNGVTLVGGTSGAIPGTDPTLGGALRFTNPSNNESGAIVSNFTFPLSSQGIQVTFTTESYAGDSGGCGGALCGNDGADGMSFFLEDATQPPDLGGLGGSLAYSCSNDLGNYDPTLRSNGHTRGNDGLVGAYIGVGIDEYGNFLNPGDNTATGPGQQYNRIGLRGAGNIGWSWLSANYSSYYPSSLTDVQRGAAVQATCASGVLMNFNPSSSGYGAAVVNAGSTIPLLDYNALSYSLLPTGTQIANESAVYRGNGSTAQLTSQYGVPITYSLKITPGGLLTLSYSYDGGASQPVITGTNIIATNGTLPANVRFGFAGSTGGSTNIHEIMCFQASPQTSSSSSVSSNQKQAAEVVQGSQVYFSFYDPTTWAGSVTSDSLLIDVNNNAYLASAANWDASCVLTGVAAGATCTKTGVAGPTAAEGPTARTMLTWNGTASTPVGIPFEWTSLPAAYQTALDTGDSGTAQNYRLKYLRGDRTNEQNSLGTGALTATGYRDRVSVLGDIIDSSPTWVGPPSAPYTAVWTDSYNGGTMPENSSSAQTYPAFTAQEQTRINVVYAGANDGFLHGFRSGYYNSSGTYVGTGTGASFVGTQNDGQELLAYMPAYVLNNIQTTTVASDYSSPQYGHQFDVDATPATGEVFYNNLWHTWLIGGLGPGGAAIYALNITNPASASITTDPAFSETNASSIVIGEWSTKTVGTTTSSTLTCVHTTATANSAAHCGRNLGNTYGTPQIRRFHNGQWGAVFGNGFGSSSGDGGIYVMVLDSSSGTPSFYYLSTKTAGQANGIAYADPVDLDGDHITDYVYAGDLLGNVWRFDLTNADPTQWAVTVYPGTSGALYSSGQPITTKVQALSVSLSGPNQRLLIEFGTGQQIPQTNSSAATYTGARQSIYGIWDWNLATWNAKSGFQYAALPYNGVLAPTASLTTAVLQQQTYTDVSSGGTDYRQFNTSNPICWAGQTGCTTSSTEQYGWYLPLDFGYSNANDVNALLSSSSTSPEIYEQVIYNPVLVGDTLLVNTAIPPATSYTTCFSAVAGGYTMAINPSTGAAFATTVFGNKTSTSYNYSGIGLSGVGTPLVVTTSANCVANCNSYLVTQTVSGTPIVVQPNLPGNIQGTRLTWIQRR
jgi:type IV pilus assembly protein PilY1